MSTDSDRYAEERYYEEDEPREVDEYGFEIDRWETGEDESAWRFWDEGIITLLIVGGAILFLIPEPTTSGVGILTMGVGVLLWLVDWMT